MKLGRLGAWYSMDRLTGPQIVPFLRTVEELGYDTLWYSEATGYESLTIAGYMLANTTRLKLGSAIATIYGRDPFAARRGLITLRALYGDRFVFGLGVSHASMVQARGQRYERPIPAMRAYLDAILEDQPGSEEWPIAIAALGPKMLALAAEKTRGALPGHSTPEHTRQARAILGASKWLIVEQKVCLESDATRARALGRTVLSRFMTMPNYRDHWLRIGFSEADLAESGSDRFVDAMVAWGDADAIKARLRAHLDAGATQVCIDPVHTENDFTARDRMFAALADT